MAVAMADKAIEKLFRHYRLSFIGHSREGADQQAFIRVFYEFLARGGDLEYVRRLVQNQETRIIDYVTYLDFDRDLCPLHHKEFVEYAPGPRRCLCEDCDWEEANSAVPEGAWT